MISYKLAKQLKDAGFPQKDNIYSMAYGKKDRARIYSVIDIDEGGDCIDCIVPTLSELIEACGNGFYGLRKWTLLDKNGDEEKDGWQAMDNFHDDKEHYDEIGTCQGKTPEEAVARLYLKLQNGRMKEWDKKTKNNIGIGKEKTQDM